MKKNFVAAAFAILLAGCASSANLPTLSLTPEQVTYRLGVGDQLKITVYGEERLTGEFPVNGQGNVAFPLLGEVSAAGRTLQEFEKEISAGLADGFVNNPNVTVEVANYRPYYILGEVGKPGEYQLPEGLPLWSADARAGGFTFRANKKRIYIRHKSGGDEVAYRLEGSTPVQPGDTIRVSERLF